MSTTTSSKVELSYGSLQSQHKHEQDRGAVKRSRIFQEWAHGRVLLDEEETAKRLAYYSGDATCLLATVCDEFVDLRERRLVPALAPSSKDPEQYVVVLILKP